MKTPDDSKPDGTSDNSAFVTAASFDDPVAAAGLCDRLRLAGLPARIHDERRLQRLWFSAPSKAGVHVQVRSEHVDAAKQKLGEWEASHDVWPPPVHCPACKSPRIQYPNMTRKFLLPTLVAQCATWLGLMEHEYYCEDCQFTWVGSERNDGEPSPEPKTTPAGE